MTVSEMHDMEELRKELKARREILDAIANNLGEGNCWMKAADINWRQRLIDFAADRESHRISRKEWSSNRGNGVTLYLIADFAVAYFDDANTLWDMCDDNDDLHAWHVIGKDSGPHRICIHMLHLVTWIRHLAESCYPVQVIDGQFICGDE